MQPYVRMDQLDGALGVMAASGSKLLAVLGPATNGPVDSPSAFGRIAGLRTAHGAGPMVEASAIHLERTRRAALVVRTGATTAGAAGTVDLSERSGTSVVTVTTSGVQPNGDYDVLVRVRVGGTIGEAGILFEWSLNDGETLSAETALGTATNFTIPGSGVVLAFAAGTLVTDDVVRVRTTAPKWNSTELGAALDALGNTTTQWEGVHIVGPLDGAAVDVIEAKFAGFYERGRFCWWMGHFRRRGIEETHEEHKEAFDSAFGVKSTIYGTVTFGDTDTVSAISSRRQVLPVSFGAASHEIMLSEEQNSAAIDNGALVGVSIADENGNPKHHNESIYPGPDDSRAYVLRTWPRRSGVYVNRPRLLSPEGSDFQLIPHRRVMNLGLEALTDYFVRRLNKVIYVDRKTGFILESEAEEIETGALVVLRSVLMAKPKASGVLFELSRTDNLLSTKTLTGEGGIIPVAYPEVIRIPFGFVNPAMLIQAA